MQRQKTNGTAGSAKHHKSVSSELHSIAERSLHKVGEQCHKGTKPLRGLALADTKKRRSRAVSDDFPAALCSAPRPPSRCTLQFPGISGMHPRPRSDPIRLVKGRANRSGHQRCLFPADLGGRPPLPSRRPTATRRPAILSRRAVPSRAVPSRAVPCRVGPRGHDRSAGGAAACAAAQSNEWLIDGQLMSS